MKVEKMIEWLSELPQDYEMNFSQYTSIVGDDEEEYFVVTDDPIVGYISNDDTKEVRFFTQSSDERVVREIEQGKDWRKLDE